MIFSKECRKLCEWLPLFLFTSLAGNVYLFLPADTAMDEDSILQIAIPEKDHFGSSLVSWHIDYLLKSCSS